MQEAARQMVHTSHYIEPKQQRHEEYQFYVDKYIVTYPQLRDLMHVVAQHVASSDRLQERRNGQSLGQACDHTLSTLFDGASCDIAFRSLRIVSQSTNN